MKTGLLLNSTDSNPGTPSRKSTPLCSAAFGVGGRQPGTRIPVRIILRQFAFLAILLLLIATLPAIGQDSLPDAPVPQNNAPAPPAATPEAPNHPVPDAGPSPENTAPSPAQPQPQPANDAAEQPPPPQPEITTLAPGQKPSGTPAPQEELYTYSRVLNFVQVPVTVKDEAGHLVNGLLRPNFAVLENGVRQNIVFFTSDPFPISAALIVDVDLPNTALDRIKQTFGALVGAFSEFDELAVYTYGNIVRLQQDFLGAQSEKTASTLSSVRKMEGLPSGPAIKDSPMTSGPSINGRQVPDTGGGSISSMQNQAYPESAVLNDAILRAGVDLGHRDPTRRRILFIISDGREKGSTASYDDVKKVLLTNNVTVFAVGTDTAAMPLYEKLSRVRLPRQGYGNILPKYASATGGEVLAEFTRSAIEHAYSQLTDQARNQYTLGYYSNAPKNSLAYRSIDVRVNRPKLRVYARDGYYPAPPPK
jgi:VWFA-related protein